MNTVPETLLGLVSQYSPSGKEDSAVAYLLERMQSLGFNRVFQDAVGNAIGIIGKGPRQIILLGHIDTVPGEIPVQVKDGMLYARGSVDAKGPLAVFTDAASIAGEHEGWQIIVIGAVGEETDSRGAWHLLDQYCPEMLVIGEPSAWNRITLGYKGCAQTEITTRCNASHSANSEDTACEVGLKIWQKILEWTANNNAGCKRRFDQLQNHLLSWRSGNDGFEDWATFRIETRLPLSLSPDTWMMNLQELAGENNVQFIGRPIQAFRGEKNSSLVRSFLKAIRKEGGRPGFVVKTGTADMNIVAPAWQCPAVAYGPGDSSLDHTPNEHLSLDEYVKAVDVLTTMLVDQTSKP